MTVPTSNTSSVSNLDFNLDNFPPPRPSTSANTTTHTVTPLWSTYHTILPRMPTPSSLKTFGLPSSPRPPRSPRSLENGVRRFASQRPRSGWHGSLAGFFSHKAEPELDMPIQEHSPVRTTSTHVDANLPSWPPLHIEKRPQSSSCRCANPKRRKRRQICFVILIVFLVYLLANVIVLNVREFSSRTSLYGTGGTLSPAQELCLTQFTVNAPANASLYPCSTCLSFLQAIPDSFKFSTTDGSQTLSNSLQFCGLQSLIGASDVTARSSLTNGGWVQDVNFCTWTGVQCDSLGRVQSLEMVFPAVPSVLPSGIGALTSLQTLQITGGNNVPAGNFPDSFANLTALTTLHLENTVLSAPPSTLFKKDALDGLTTLTLVKNADFGGSLPDVSGLPLQSFIVSGQQLSSPLSNLLNSTSLQQSLTTLSLTSSNLTGSFPFSASFSSLQTLSLANNPGLSGTVPDALCQSTELTSCDLTGTALTSAAGSCGICTF